MAWAIAVLIGWETTTIVVGLVTPADAGKPASSIIEQAVLIAAIPCLLMGGLGAAVALRFATRQDTRQARRRGWMVGLVVLVAILATTLAAGALIAPLVVPVVLVVAAAEVELALRLYCREGMVTP